METIDNNLLDADSESFIPSESIIYLAEIRKWAKFLSILGFVGMTLLVAVGFAMGGLLSSLYGLEDSPLPIPGFAFGFIYLIFAAIYFFPIYYLYKFSSHMKNALALNNNIELNASFKYLKSHYKFIGIFMIVIMVIYALALIGILAMGGLATSQAF